MESDGRSHEELPKHGDLSPDEQTVHQEVREATTGMREATDESTLSEKVEVLRRSLNEISEEVYSWRGKDFYLDAIEGVKQQVDDIQEEWDAIRKTMNTERERLESLLQAFPGVIETATLRALSMRLRHLEEVVAEMMNEQQNKATAERARKQLTISIIALITTVVMWGIFILLRFLPS